MTKKKKSILSDQRFIVLLVIIALTAVSDSIPQS